MVLGDLHLNFGDYVKKIHGGAQTWDRILATAGLTEDSSRWVSSCPYSDSVFEG